MQYINAYNNEEMGYDKVTALYQPTMIKGGRGRNIARKKVLRTFSYINVQNKSRLH